MPTRVGLSVFGSTSATLEIWIAASSSTMPAWRAPRAPAFMWRFTTFTSETFTRIFSVRISRIVPRFPLSLPAITSTVSPRLSLSFTFVFVFATAIGPPSPEASRPGTVQCARLDLLEDFGGERDDLHEVLLAQLAGDRPEDARAARVAGVGGQDHGGVVVELDVRAVRPTIFFGRPHDHRLDHVALL